MRNLLELSEKSELSEMPFNYKLSPINFIPIRGFGTILGTVFGTLEVAP